MAARSRKKILLVDDDPVILKLVERALCEHGFAVICASNGHEAMESAKKETPDLIILDVLLPGLDGTEIAGLLQEDLRTHHIPVLYLTSLEPKEDQVLEENLKPDIIFTKPTNMNQLVEKVKDVTKNRN